MRSDLQEILYHRHHISQKHLPMSKSGRSSEFSPFKALDSHKEMIGEEGRLTEFKYELSDDDAASLNQTLSYLLVHQYEEISLKLTYFNPDSKKEGGSYVDYKGIFKYFREDTRCLVFRDGNEISVDDIEKFEI